MSVANFAFMEDFKNIMEDFKNFSIDERSKSSCPTPTLSDTSSRFGSDDGCSMIIGHTHHMKLNRSISAPKDTSLSRYKTELCHPFVETGLCKYANKCQFAHGVHELRNLVRHPKYKTELCRTFHRDAICPYGARCHFIHDIGSSSNSISNLSPPSSASSSTSFSTFFPPSPSISPAISESNQINSSPPFNPFNYSFQFGGLTA